MKLCLQRLCDTTLCPSTETEKGVDWTLMSKPNKPSNETRKPGSLLKTCPDHSSAKPENVNLLPQQNRVVHLCEIQKQNAFLNFLWPKYMVACIFLCLYNHSEILILEILTFQQVLITGQLYLLNIIIAMFNFTLWLQINIILRT